MTGNDLAEAALTLVGTPYRLHGRDPASGLDCIGLFAAALSACGKKVRLPQNYRLRMAAVPTLEPLAAELGFAAVQSPTKPGDVILVRPGPAQLHLLIAAGGARFIHAHAGLRRVVVSSVPINWLPISTWRHATLHEE